MPRLSQALLSVIQNACSDETSISAAQLKELLRLALLAKNFTVRHGITNGEAWDTSSWTLARTKLQASVRYKSSTGLTKLCDQIIHTSNSGQKSEPRGGLKRKAHTTEQLSPASKRTKKSKEQDNN
jgi:DNA polymerase phi